MTRGETGPECWNGYTDNVNHGARTWLMVYIISCIQESWGSLTDWNSMMLLLDDMELSVYISPLETEDNDDPVGVMCFCNTHSENLLCSTATL